MADIVAVKTINGQSITRTFNKIAWDSLGFNKQGWAEVNGTERLKEDVPVSEKKNKAAVVKAATDVKPVEVEPELDESGDGIPGVTEPSIDETETTEKQPKTDEKISEQVKAPKVKTKQPRSRKPTKKVKK